jgi:glycosyltransferase involved in cell wall biosynthesis
MALGEALRVLLVGHTYVVGANQAKLDAIAASGGADIGLLVPTSWPAADWRTRFALQVASTRIRVFSTAVWFAGRNGAHLYPPWFLCFVVSRFRPNLIHVEQEVFSLAAFELAVAARLARRPLVIFCWENCDRTLSLFRRMTRRFVLSTADTIIAGNTGARELLRTWGYRGPVELMPQLGVEATPGAVEPIRVDPGCLTIGYAGRLVHEKGVDLILRALRTLVDRGVNARLHAVGTGPLADELRRDAEALGVGHLVEWRGAVSHSEVQTEMSRMDVLVLPSRSTATWREQFGHVLIEAMAIGLPVIGSRSGAIPDVIGKEDVLFAEDNVEGLVELLTRLAHDQEWRKELGASGVRRVSEHFTHDRLAERLVGIWERIGTGWRT